MGVKIMDNIHKNYYLIVFTAYMREMAEVARTTMTDEQKAALTLPGGKTAIPGNQLKLPKTFVAFMEEHSDLRGLIDSGKGDLQWERDIPAAALANLEKLAAGDFKANLGKIIHDIYQTAHLMFSDMPQGDQEARQVQVCFQDSDEDPPSPCEGRGGESYREEGHHTGPLRDSWQVHLEACLNLHSLWKSHPKMLLKLKILFMLPS